MMFPTATPLNPPSNPACHDQDYAIAKDVLLCMRSLQVKNGSSNDCLSLTDECIMVDFAFKAIKKEKEWKGRSDGSHGSKYPCTIIDNFDFSAAANAASKDFKINPAFIAAAVNLNATTQDYKDPQEHQVVQDVIQPFGLFHEDNVSSINNVHTIFC